MIDELDITVDIGDYVSGDVVRFDPPPHPITGGEQTSGIAYRTAEDGADHYEVRATHTIYDEPVNGAVERTGYNWWGNVPLGDRDEPRTFLNILTGELGLPANPTTTFIGQGDQEERKEYISDLDTVAAAGDLEDAATLILEFDASHPVYETWWQRYGDDGGAEAYITFDLPAFDPDQFTELFDATSGIPVNGRPIEETVHDLGAAVEQLQENYEQTDNL